MGAAQSSRLADTLDPEDVPETLEKLRAASIRSESDLKMLNAGEWLELGLSLGVRKRLQQKVGSAQPAAGAVSASPAMSVPAAVARQASMFSFSSSPAETAAMAAAKAATQAADLVDSPCYKQQKS